MQIGIDIGGSHISASVISIKNIIVAKREKDIKISEQILDKKQYIVDNIEELINQVLKDAGMLTDRVSKIGIATPGKVKENVIYDMYNLGIKEFNLADILSKKYGAEVKIRNDAKCSALAEKKIGSLQGYKDSIFLCLGTGIGGATFINGKMLEYTKEWGSEYGHMVIEKNGVKCNCGNRGCFEKYASMQAFKQGFLKVLNLNKEIDSKQILEILKEKADNKEVKKYIEEYIDNLIIGISNICNIFEPEAICLGGSFVYFEGILYKKLLEKMENENCSFIKPKIVLAKLGNDAGMLGALM